MAIVYDRRVRLVLLLLVLVCGCAAPAVRDPYIVVLGIAQDGGIPQAGRFDDPRWSGAGRKRVVCLGLVDPATGGRWLFEATPDFPEQLRLLHLSEPRGMKGAPPVSGVFVSHAHIGHYTGLMYLGHESMGAKEVPVYAMPRMREFLATSGPWSQLVKYRNIALTPLEGGVALTDRLRVTPIAVPHRQEYSEVIGYRIEGPNRRVLFIPDIDSWREWDAQGIRIEDEIAAADVAYLDGTFYADGEIPGRDMSGFPHPFITHSMERFAPLPASERAKVRFIHLNHTNPAARPGTPARRTIDRNGFRVAEELERVGL